MKKNIFIIVLIIIVLGLAGYITYDSISEQKETKSLKEEIKQLNETIETLKSEDNVIENETTTNTESIEVEATETNNNYFNTVFWMVDGEEAIVLFDDGTYLQTLGLEYQTGTYKIENGKIALTSPCVPGPVGCGTSELDISDDYKSIIDVEGNTYKNLIQKYEGNNYVTEY